MDNGQNLTNQKTPTEDITPIYKFELLNPIQQTYIDWKAMSGLITDDEGIRKLSLADLAKSMGIVRQTFYDQTKHIPNLSELINQRRYKLSSGNRLQRVHETWYLKAVKGEWQHLNAWLLNFDPKYQAPGQKLEVEHTYTYAELLAAAAKDGIIEGEVVERPAAIDATASNSNQ